MKTENRISKEVFHALETCDVAYIQSLHKNDSQVLLGVTFQKDSPLHIAAREGHMRIVQWILQVQRSLAGALNRDWNLPLHEAAKHGNPDLVRILLEHKKSSAYMYNKFGETALIIACKYGHVETVNILWDAKRYNDASETQQCLRVAAYGGYPDVVEALVGKPIKSRLSLIHFPFLDHCIDLTKAGLDGLRDIIDDDNENRRPVPNLHAAVHVGRLEIVRAMLNSPAWKDYLMRKEDECGRCAIHVAAMKGCWNIINEFMSRWPDSLEIRSSDHKSVLHFAVEYNQFEIVRNLLFNKLPQKAAEWVSQDHDLFHNTALHLAAKKGVDPQLVDYLVSFPSVNVNALNDEDMTALDIASAAAKDGPNCAKIVEILEGVGAIQLSLMQKCNTTSDPSNDSKQVWETGIAHTHMVVASLVATVTFAAIFQIPGGMEGDQQKNQYGAAKLEFNELFKFFIYSDTAAFITSFLVVIAWIVRPLFGESYKSKQSALCHMSGMTLLVSVLWTVVAFVTALVLIIIPPAHLIENKNNDVHPSEEYRRLWRNEILLAISPPATVGVLLLSLIFKKKSVKKWQKFIFSRNSIYAEFIILHVVIGYSIYFYSFNL